MSGDQQRPEALFAKAIVAGMLAARHARSTAERNAALKEVAGPWQRLRWRTRPLRRRLAQRWQALLRSAGSARRLARRPAGPAAG